jgi:hypothetical protein
MNLKFDDDVLAVLDFMQTRIPAEKLVGVAGAVRDVAGLLWGRYAPQEVIAVQVEQPSMRG